MGASGVDRFVHHHHHHLRLAALLVGQNPSWLKFSILFIYFPIIDSHQFNLIQIAIKFTNYSII